MNFTSPLFLIGFPLVLAIYGKMPGRPHSLFSRQTFLLLASWMFYMGGSLRCFPLLLLVTLVTFLFGILIENARAAKNGHAKVFLSLVLVIVFTILFFFKYFGFLQDTLFQLIGVQGRGIRLPLPAGISFYTFQSISYCLDVYRGRRKAERSFRDFALFVSFFPQLVAGPIERADDLLPQLTACPLPTGSDTRAGAFYLLRGFFKKIAIADFVSLYVTALFDADRYSGPLTVLAGILFGFQIYADFSGYSDIALGAARLLGIRLHVNFDSPYLADSI
ncbi:MAG: MBOAT family protein, partial [Lachnospiraceae bacterium]|nr:MBOAT family protein [Lachnospiraceae bacterium]